MECVDILLSTYNGDNYIDELIESVMTQSYSNIHLIVRDDGSKDTTVEKILAWKEKFSDKITLLQDDRGNVGVSRSMFALLKQSQSPYIIFCDQDDVWFENKVSRLVKGMKIKEKQYPKTPMIVHCEAYTTDSKLNLVEEDKERSLHQYQMGRNKKQTSFANLLLANPVQGASMIFNEMLRQQMLPILDVPMVKDVIFDSLVASVCSISGKIFFLNEPLMYYRQHARNIVGASRTSLLKMKFYNEKQISDTRIANFLVVNKKKCNLLNRYYRNSLNEYQKGVLDHFMKRPNNWIEFMKLGMYKEFTCKQIAIMVAYRIRL